MAIVTTNDKHYGDIADAIRTMADIETTFLPSEMAAGILAIPSGGGDIDALIDRSITTISSNVETIREWAFYGCESLVSVSFPLATTILSGAFAECTALEEIKSTDFPLVTYMDGSYDFWKGGFSFCTSLTSINFPLVETIGHFAFTGCEELKTIDFPLATEVESYAFEGCTSLISINLPLVETIEASAFEGCEGLTTIDFPLATEVEPYAFPGCLNLMTATLPLMATVGNGLFYNCQALEVVDLAAVTKIETIYEQWAFEGCESLTTLIIRTPTLCTLDSHVEFAGTPIQSGTGYIYVPSTLVASYKIAPNWAVFQDQIRAIEDYPEITGG